MSVNMNRIHSIIFNLKIVLFNKIAFAILKFLLFVLAASSLQVSRFASASSNTETDATNAL